MTREQRIDQLRRMARVTDELADEYRARADELEAAERGHECGHLWTISVTARGHYGVTGDPEHHDAADDDGDPWRLSVRAHSLVEAMREAARHPLIDWRTDWSAEED